MNKILQVRNLTYKSIFRDLNLDIQKDTVNLISGSNKCGKTTLIEILSGIIEVEDTCFYFSSDITKLKSKEFATTFSSVIFNGNFNFTFPTLNQELQFYLDRVELTVSERKMRYKNLVRLFKLDKSLYIDINDMSYFEKIKSLVMFSLLRRPKVLLLDNILDDLSDNEGEELINILKTVGGMTIIISTDSLSLSYLFDYIHIIDKNKVILSGNALDVLKEDSLLNKIGLSLPFMVDLSIKLQYYGLVDDISLDMNRMVDELWK